MIMGGGELLTCLDVNVAVFMLVVGVGRMVNCKICTCGLVNVLEKGRTKNILTQYINLIHYVHTHVKYEYIMFTYIIVL